MLGDARSKPSLPVAIGVCVVVAAAYVFFRLYVYAERLVPLTYALPLLVGIWHRNRALNLAQVVFYVFVATLNIFIAGTAGLATSEVPNLVMMYVNILIAGIVVDLLIGSRERMLQANLHLQQANAELEASNEELAARDEEISSQNEELQQQAEELEQQSAELQQQTEELQQQTEELQLLHLDSSTRAHLLQALLNVTTSSPDDATAEPLDQICAAAATAFGPEVSAALLFRLSAHDLVLEGQSGTASRTDQRSLLAWADDPFIRLVRSEGRAACIED